MKQGIDQITDLSSFKAVADLGSNTFHLMVGRLAEGRVEVLLHKRAGVGIGKDGMEKKLILPEAKERALQTLELFAHELKKIGIQASEADVYATSAFRNASNSSEVLQEIKKRTGFRPRIISGREEASLIFKGVLGSDALPADRNSLVVDIGGGSVEFIICKGKVPVWQHSFEIGGLRLMERFHQTDPLPEIARINLEEHLKEILKPLWGKTRDFTDLNLVGCSGSFDTLIDMRNAGNSLYSDPMELNSCNLISRAEFFQLFDRILPLNMEDRLSLPGMIPLRAGMMVVAVVLIKVLLEETSGSGIMVSNYSLREGALFEHFLPAGNEVY
jgi:exopolyphosphatase/guanosine-5'-triphosphate,3'-diphosphate pyrophosphatase